MEPKRLLPGGLTLLLLLASPLRAWAQAPQGVSTPPVHFAPAPGRTPVEGLGADEWVLRGPARPGAYVDAIGRKAAWIGTEQGVLEAWIWPYKIFHRFNLAVRTGEVGGEIDLAPLARTVEIRPYGVQIDYVHSRFRVRQTLFALADEPVLAMLLEVDTSIDLTLVASFVPDLAPMWPAGMGGQYAYFDASAGGYVLGESRGVISAVVGSGDAARGSSAPAHQLAGAGAFEIPVPRGRAGRGPITLVVTGGEEERSALLDRMREAAGRGPELLEERKRVWGDAHPFVDLQLPRQDLEESYRWAVSSLTDGFQYAPGLGTGLVAGFGPTGSGYRPGFSWYFGGDTSINSFGLVAAGQAWVLAGAFPFLEQYQREDGKMMHELTRSAPLIDWFGEFPYAYIHGDTTPFYVVALANYYRWTGDRALLERSWPHLLKAYAFGMWADEDGDGLMDNSRAGLGASELGTLREGLKTGVFIATVWTQALSDLAYLGRQLGEADRSRRFEADHERARARLAELFVDRRTGTLNFGITAGGEPKNEATAWATFPVVFGLIGGEAAENTLDMVASAGITTDWGTRMLSEGSSFYDPVGYNSGAVWPFLTGYVAMAEYRAGRRYAGYQHLLQVSATTFIDALGRNPEVMSGDYFTVLETSVPHQLFSSSPVPANLIRGVIGLDLDLPNRSVVVRPQLPGGWREVRLSGYPLPGGGTLDLHIEHRLEGQTSNYILSVNAPAGLTVRYEPVPVPLERLAGPGWTSVTIGPDGSAVMALGGRRGIDFVIDGLAWGPVAEGAVHTAPGEGDPPSGLRFVRVDESGGDRVRVVLEGRSGYVYRLPFEAPAAVVVEDAEGAAVRVTGGPGGEPALLISVTSVTGEPVGVDDYRRFSLLLRVRR